MRYVAAHVWQCKMNAYKIRYVIISDPNLVTRFEYVVCNSHNEAIGLFWLHHDGEDLQVTSVDLWDILD